MVMVNILHELTKSTYLNHLRLRLMRLDQIVRFSLLESATLTLGNVKCPNVRSVYKDFIHVDIDRPYRDAHSKSKYARRPMTHKLSSTRSQPSPAFQGSHSH